MVGNQRYSVWRDTPAASATAARRSFSGPRSRIICWAALRMASALPDRVPSTDQQVSAGAPSGLPHTRALKSTSEVLLKLPSVPSNEALGSQR